ncbi:Alpha-N-acetylgalactosaminide alpha-2,6-sialyltransferase 5 [Larimichthys crocea]|uniref:Alpha-N-acetylgalactosaminide alpha-2,6-sialyltransferase 5 n=1 Tax=Larimichthys crocea TaxID=215358 RepID=A0A6G0I1F1_LARCR|nr:Alpha-N-acetylgalactosaminide alpha-2,6-sialyltransferase 5 [Larimichthys crocea]
MCILHALFLFFPVPADSLLAVAAQPQPASVVLVRSCDQAGRCALPAARSTGLRGYMRISPGRKDQFLDMHCPQCALVSSSGQMLGAGVGEEIDKIGCVIRMNNATTRGQSADTTYVFWGPERNMRQDGKGRIFNVLLKIAKKYPKVKIYAVTKEKISTVTASFRMKREKTE